MLLVVHSVFCLGLGCFARESRRMVTAGSRVPKKYCDRHRMSVSSNVSIWHVPRRQRDRQERERGWGGAKGERGRGNGVEGRGRRKEGKEERA